MKFSSKCFGNWAEEAACAFFQKKGYDILEKNYRTPLGEIDLIVKQGNYIVFVEVKARTSDRYGGPEEAITEWKKDRILKVAKWYIMEKGIERFDFRFDCVFFIGENENTKIHHIVSAFEA